MTIVSQPQFNPYTPPQQGGPQYTAQPWQQPQSAGQQYQAAPQAPQQYAPPPPQWGPPAQQFPPQGYGAPQAPQQPTTPVITGSLDDWDNQPVGGSGKAISWDANKGVQIGHTIVGRVRRNLTGGDVQQMTDYQTKQPKFRRDGTPMWQLVVPLQCEPTQEVPTGEFALYVRGDLAEKLGDACRAVGRDNGRPVAGDWLTVSLIERRNTGQGSPKSIFQVHVQPDGEGTPPAPQQPPAANPAPPQYQQVPMQTTTVPAAQPPAQPYNPPAPQQAPTGEQPLMPPITLPQQPQALAQPAQQAAPAGSAAQALAGLNAEQQEMWAKLQQQGQQGGQA